MTAYRSMPGLNVSTVGKQIVNIIFMGAVATYSATFFYAITQPSL